MRPTHDRLREVLDYNPESGVFTWLVKVSRKVLVGAEAGSLSHGYRSIQFDQRSYGAHILAWFWMTGEWPERGIDHINGVRDDNRWVNLRIGGSGLNEHNVVAPNKNNTSGFRGVCLSKGRWKAQIGVNGKIRYLGQFDTPEEASAAYWAAKAEHHGEETYRGRLS